MMLLKYTYWQDGEMWLGYLEEYTVENIIGTTIQLQNYLNLFHGTVKSKYGNRTLLTPSAFSLNSFSLTT